jgi:hypothetical protein
MKAKCSGRNQQAKMAKSAKMYRKLAIEAKEENG